MNANSIITARTTLQTKWKGLNKPYRITTRPYRSVACLALALVETKLDLSSKISYGIYRIEKGQRLEWFSIGLSDMHPQLGRLSEADTNQINGYKTNGGEDFAIEGISASCRAPLFIFNSGTISTHVTDADVKRGLLDGSCVIADPGCLLTPPQLSSPFNLENSIFEVVAPHVALKIEFGRSQTDYLTELGNIPEGVGRSYLRSHGEPTTTNRFRIPEGIQWLGQTGADSEMVVRGEVTRDIVIPLNAVANVAFVDPILPETVLLPIQMRLHGAVFSFPSKN